MPTIAIDEQEALSDFRNAHCNANFANLMKRYNNLPLKKMMSFKQNSTAKDAELKPLLTPEQYAS